MRGGHSHPAPGVGLPEAADRGLYSATTVASEVRAKLSVAALMGQPLNHHLTKRCSTP